MNAAELHRGDWVIYRKTKQSPQPGPRAEDVSPASHGDLYTYAVEKFWVVDAVQSDGAVVLVTHRGKRHVIDPSTPLLRKANWWERWRYRSRFEDVARHVQSTD